ncbi:RagB/SusD family nutrient uptake outer membrane protein [Flexithrix dorotheae]|uniref:RagB/SusD family nutrient uptake outer membrane protein n=1 Tax=Flexithrix dorotheae TaxID=70993 RepID=UPI00036C425C|nr:RagB/SusD family nutrient uptake outer membrane protein [Flexithrix dorotheae]
MKISIKKLFAFIILITGLLGSCSDSYLDEVPLDRFSPENLLENEAGYDAALIALYNAAREEHIVASNNFEYMSVGTDLAQWGRNDSRGLKDYSLLNSNLSATIVYWDWAYKEMIVRANLILEDIDNPALEISDEIRSNIKGQALFFRGYTYNFLANIYGGVPIVAERITVPKFDFVRVPREEVLRFAANDLELASELLAVAVPDGRVPKAAAFHLLSEVYISIGMESGDDTFFDKSIASASKVINKEVGDYEIMTNRFGPASSEPGDVFSDLFAYGQVNRTSGNKEVMWAWQFESFILGGSTNGGIGNNGPRYWAPEYDKIISPNGFKNTPADSLIRGIGVNSPTNYVKYDIWAIDPDDIRNSEFNIRRTFYYNNPDDTEYYGKEIKAKRGVDGELYIVASDGTLTDQKLDTLRQYYPWIRKVDGAPFDDNVASGNTSKDLSRMRVAETYLLRAEAYFRKGNIGMAAMDINTVRERANAKLITSMDVTEDFILDERTRELLVEEPRLRTLIRMGRLVDRVRKYNSAPSVPGGPSSGTTIQDFNNFWPIPQKVIDANTGAEMPQNPGYPGS